MADGTAAHLVLFRKWRPGRLEDLVGQDHVTKVLRQALIKQRVAHAFLFCGIHGVGKTSAARILARCLNCERGPTPDPCGQCRPCVEIAEGRSLDVVEIDGATYRKIDDARAIIENLAYRPARDRYKVYIIDEAHQLTDQAFNALLKTLEEPPPHVKFILATTEPQKMPETILSRLQRYDFRRIPLPLIIARLNELARREGVEAEAGALALIAREAAGSLRDAERMLETAVAGAKDVVRESDVAQMLGVASREHVAKLASMVVQKQAAAALKMVRELYEAGITPEILGRELLELLRNLALAKLESESREPLLSNLPDFEAEELRQMAQSLSLRDINRLFRLMSQAQEEVLRSAYPEVVLEMSVVRMATLAPVIEAEELLSAIKALQAANPVDAPTATASSPLANQSTKTHRRVISKPQTNHPKSSQAEHSAPLNSPDSSAVGPRVDAQELDVRSSADVSDASLTSKIESGAASASASVGAREASSGAEQPFRAPKPQNDHPEQTISGLGNDLPELRRYIREKAVPLASFMEQSARLRLENDVLIVAAVSDFYAHYFRDKAQLIAELASEYYGRQIRVKVVWEEEVASELSQSEVLSSSGLAFEEKSQSAQAPEIARQASGEVEQRVANSSPDQQNNRSGRIQALKNDPLVKAIFDQLDARLLNVCPLPTRTGFDENTQLKNNGDSETDS